MKRLSVLLGLLFLYSLAGAASLPGPLVDGAWLARHKDDPGLVILDIQDRRNFQQHHIPGAVNLPFAYWRTPPTARPPVSLPPLDKLAARLGIARDTPLVIVSMGAGAGDMAGATRVYWSLAVLGHAQMAVLNGGLVSYVNAYHGRYESGKAATRKPVTYEPRPQKALLATAAQLRQGVDQPLLDARSEAEYVGLIGGVGDRRGTIPGAHHLPFDWLVDETGRIRDAGAVKKLFAYAGVPEGGAVHFCQTGHRGAMTWFADYAILGNHKARLYDGSMMEWAADPKLPLERKLTL